MKSLKDNILEKLIINRNIKSPKNQRPSIDNIIKYLNDECGIDDVWTQDSFWEQHWSNETLKKIEDLFNGEKITPQMFYCNKNMLLKKQVEELEIFMGTHKGVLRVRTVNVRNQNKYNIFIIYNYKLDQNFND